VRKAAISGWFIKGCLTYGCCRFKQKDLDKQNLTDPATVMTFLVTQANKADKQTTKLS
jgi:hypothetical protein